LKEFNFRAKEIEMNTNEGRVPNVELRKNLFAGGLVGAAYGLLYAYGFERNIWLPIITGALFGVVIGFRISVHPPRMRYPMYMARRMAYAGTFLLLASVVYAYLLDLELTRTQIILATLLPTVGWAALIISIGMAIASLDELQRRIQTEAIAIGFAGTAILVGAYSLLQFAGFGQINVGVVLLVMAVMWLVGKLWTLWRYR
jgi:hypothetical protein